MIDLSPEETYLLGISLLTMAVFLAIGALAEWIATRGGYPR